MGYFNARNLGIVCVEGNSQRGARACSIKRNGGVSCALAFESTDKNEDKRDQLLIHKNRKENAYLAFRMSHERAPCSDMQAASWPNAMMK